MFNQRINAININISKMSFSFPINSQLLQLSYASQIELKKPFVSTSPLPQLPSIIRVLRQCYALFKFAGSTEAIVLISSLVTVVSWARLLVLYRRTYHFSFDTVTYWYRCVSVYHFRFIGIFENFELYICKKILK